MRKPRGVPPVLKRFGQHFLNDPATLEAIADAVEPREGETVIEIGPGRGVLTDILAARSTSLIAIEIDRLLSEELRQRYSSRGNVRIMESDVLKVDFASLVDGPFVVAGNVPYYITTPILFHVLQSPLPRHAVFLVQREVAERIVAAPGSKDYGALSVNVQAIAAAEIIRNVPPGAFRPPPKVDSSVIRITPRTDPLVSEDEIETFRRFVQGMFGMRRKQIANVLRSVAQLSPEQASRVLDSLGADAKARPETLAPATFAALMRATRSGS